MRNAIKHALIVLLFGTLPPTYLYAQRSTQDSERAALKILNVNTGETISSLSGGSGITSISYSPDGKTIAVGNSEGKVSLLNVTDGRKVGEFEGQAGAVQSVAFSRDGKKLASGSWDKTITVWDLATGQAKQVLKSGEAILSVAFSPGGDLLASGGLDKTVSIWELSSGKVLRDSQRHSDAVRSVAFSPDGEILASGADDGTVKLWNAQTGAELATLTGHVGAVESIAFSPDGALLASGSADETVGVWDLKTKSLRQTLRGHSSAVHSVAFSPDGTKLGSGGYDQTVKLWEVSTGKELSTFDNRGGVVNSVAFSPDGKAIAYGSSPTRRTTPTLHILAVGINNDPSKKLRPFYASKDAEDFASALQGIAKNKFGRVNTHLLLGKDATRKNIEAAFMRIIAEAKTFDTFVFFYSGKGASLEQRPGGNAQFYLLPVDTPSQAPAIVKKSGISAPLLQSWLNRIEARHQLLLLDSSRSARGFETFIARLRRDEKLIEDFQIRDTAIIAVTGISFEFDSIKNGLLTYTVLQCLSTDCASSQGDITAQSLITFTLEKNPQHLNQFHNAVSRKWVKKYPGSAGKVTFYSAGKDFPLGSPSAGPQTHVIEGGGRRSGALSAQHDQTLGAVRRESFRARGREAGPLFITTGNRPLAGAGKNYALLFGTDQYEHMEQLSNPIRDARAIADELKVNYGFDSPVLVTDATKKEIINHLRVLKNREYAPEDQLFIFFAGHGHYIEEFKQGYIVAKDSKSEDEFGESYLDYAVLKNLINSIPCEHIFLVIDACFSGTIDEGVVKHRGLNERSSTMTASEFFNRKVKYKTRKYLTSGGKEYVPDGRPGRHSPFTTRLLEALRTWGGDNGYMTIKGIAAAMDGLEPEPFLGEWGDNEPGSDFVFIVTKQKDGQAASARRHKSLEETPAPQP